jgi:simple sugar transport system permease protein
MQFQLQGTKLMGAAIPSGVFSSLPYIVTVIALAGFLGKSKAPAGLGKI